jgi:2-methylcitrate dehydratase PrpD
MDGVTVKLAEFNSQLTYEQISANALKNVKKCLLDSLGCAFFGALTECGKIVNDFVQSQEGVHEATLWSTDFVGPAANVVLGNGTMIHSFDFDDYHMTKIHIGAVVIPAALAIGEKEHIDGKKLLTAIVSGYETMIHLSRAINPGASRLKGWHLTGTCGTFAASVAAGNIWQLDSNKMANAIGMAGTQSAGLWAFTADGSLSKRFHPGRSAQSGILAASLARRGYRGPTKILEAEDGGFFKATSYDYDFSKVTEGLGEKFDTEDVVIKPYPAAGSLHSSIEAALIIMKKNEIDIERIKKVNVYNSEIVNFQCGFDYSPMGPLQAQMSLKYCVARSILDGMVTIAQFREDKLSDPVAVNLSKRVKFVRHAEIDNIYPREFPSIVEIVTNDGRKYEARVDYPKGSKENPMTWEDVQDKFKIHASDMIGEEKVNTIIDIIMHLEDIKDISDLMNQMKKL